jgi:hypothetical protein
MRRIAIAGLIATLLPSLGANAQTTDEIPAGVAAAVNTTAQGFPPARPMHTLVIGSAVVASERIDTDPDGQAQFLFRDGSTFTVSENSSVVIDRFIYDPDSGQGDLSMSLARGVFRFVGGKLSKDGSVQFTTPTALLSVRGGIALIDVGAEGNTQATFLYGDQLTVTVAGKTQIIRRPGYQVTIVKGEAPSAPKRAPGSYVSATLQKLSGKSSASGGAATKPTATVVAKLLATPPKNTALAAVVAKAPQPSRAADQQAAAAAIPIAASPAAASSAPTAVKATSSVSAATSSSASAAMSSSASATSATAAVATKESVPASSGGKPSATPKPASVVAAPPKPALAKPTAVINVAHQTTTTASQHKTTQIVHPKVPPKPVVTPVISAKPVTPTKVTTVAAKP